MSKGVCIQIHGFICTSGESTLAAQIENARLISLRLAGMNALPSFPARHLPPQDYWDLPKIVRETHEATQDTNQISSLETQSILFVL